MEFQLPLDTLHISNVAKGAYNMHLSLEKEKTYM